MLNVLDKIVRAMAPRSVVVRDHWVGDRCAIGLSSESHPDRLVYISTFNRPLGRYYFECEPMPAALPPRRGDDVDFTTLLDVIRAHLF